MTITIVGTPLIPLAKIFENQIDPLISNPQSKRTLTY